MRTVVVPRSATPESAPRSMILGGTSVIETSRPPRASGGTAAERTLGRAPSARPSSTSRNEPSGCSIVARYDTSPGPTASRMLAPLSVTPWSAVDPLGATASARPDLLVPQSPRQSGIARIADPGTPSTVTPETDEAGPALAELRRTG